MSEKKTRINYSREAKFLADIVRQDGVQFALVNPNDADAFRAEVVRLDDEAKARGETPPALLWMELNEIREGWVQFLSECPATHAPKILKGPASNWWDGSHA